VVFPLQPFGRVRFGKTLFATSFSPLFPLDHHSPDRSFFFFSGTFFIYRACSLHFCFFSRSSLVAAFLDQFPLFSFLYDREVPPPFAATSFFSSGFLGTLFRVFKDSSLSNLFGSRES